MDSISLLTLFNIAGESAHVEAIKLAYYYEAGNSEMIQKTLDNSRRIDSENSLTKLLARVIAAGWPADSFATMRNELHPKVVEIIEANLSAIVGEEIA